MIRKEALGELETTVALAYCRNPGSAVLGSDSCFLDREARVGSRHIYVSGHMDFV